MRLTLRAAARGESSNHERGGGPEIAGHHWRAAQGLSAFTIALGPSMEISAPRRASSLTCMKRDSKMRSVMMLESLA
jgi:hypothetical protein